MLSWETRVWVRIRPPVLNLRRSISGPRKPKLQQNCSARRAGIGVALLGIDTSLPGDSSRIAAVSVARSSSPARPPGGPIAICDMIR